MAAAARAPFESRAATATSSARAAACRHHAERCWREDQLAHTKGLENGALGHAQVPEELLASLPLCLDLEKGRVCRVLSQTPQT